MPGIVWFLIGAVAGFVAGVLVYRNNVKKLEAKVLELEAKAKEGIDAVKAKVG